MATQTLPPSAVPVAHKSGALRTILEWMGTADHKKIGLMYIVYAVLFLVVMGIEAILMRIQLAHANSTFLSPQVFNRLFTMHGTTGVFFVAMPILVGFGNYLVPLMIGARDMAFPRLNAFSFWVTAFSGFLLYGSFFAGGGFSQAGIAPDVGWFAYAPLTAPAFSPGHSTDYWTLSIMLAGVGSIAGAANMIATVIGMRCPGMTMSRLPLFAWMNLVMGGLILVTISPLTAAQLMLMGDRYLGSHYEVVNGCHCGYAQIII